MTLAAALVALAVLGPTADVVKAEDLRVQAMRSGRDIARFYSPSYRGIDGRGQYETIGQIRALTARPGYARQNDLTVEVHDDTAIVTSIEGSGDTELDLTLRLWTRTNGVWTIAMAHTTWIGNRPGAPPLNGPLPNRPIQPFVRQSNAQESLWMSHDALMRSFADADPDSYKTFSTEKSLRMTTDGQPIARAQWLDTIARRQKGPLVGVDEMAMSFYGDVAVVSLRGHEANPTRQSWVYLREGGRWKLHLRFTTLIRSA